MVWGAFGQLFFSGCDLFNLILIKKNIREDIFNLIVLLLQSPPSYVCLRKVFTLTYSKNANNLVYILADVFIGEIKNPKQQNSRH